MISTIVLGTGAEREQIEQKIDELNLRDRVFLDGVTDNPYKYMRACDLFVLPSGWEGFPTVTVEAKLIGKPVLATDVSGIREQIVDGVSGIIVENSAEGIYCGIKKVLDEPRLMNSFLKSDDILCITENEEKYKAFFAHIH